MIEINGLSFEQNKKYNFAISQGYFEDFEANARAWRHTFVGAYVWKHPQRVRVLDILRDIIGHVPQWEDITDDVLKDLVDELVEGGLAMSSLKTMCAELKAVINSNARKVPALDFMRTLTVKGSVSQSIYLTQQEIDRFLEFTPRTPAERYVKRVFSIEMLTGARRIDAAKLTVHNCDMETGMLSYVPRKTPGIIVRVPVNERRGLRSILANTSLQHPCCLAVFNDTVRSICRSIGINDMCTITKAGNNITEPKWKLVSSHTARRSFATNLYLADVSIEDIALMMGHGKNIETTKRYICAEKEISPSVMSYFRDDVAV